MVTYSYVNSLVIVRKVKKFKNIFLVSYVTLYVVTLTEVLKI